MFVTIWNRKNVLPFGEEKNPKTFGMGNLLPKTKELNFEWLVWIMAVPRASSWAEIRTTGRNAAWSYVMEIQQVLCSRKELLFPFSWFLPVGDLQYRGPVVCPGTAAKFENSAQVLILEFLKHKLSLLRSFLWTEDAGVGLEEFSWFSQTELKCHLSSDCLLFGKREK